MDDQSVYDIREGRGTLTSPGRNGPFRDRSVEENAELFARMRAGEFRNGERVLRAKIDMASANINLRDPVIYRILNASHPRTGAVWHIYPSYDFAHGQSDAIGAGGRKVGATIHWVSAVDAFTSATGRRDFCGQFPGRSAPMYKSMTGTSFIGQSELAVQRFSIGTDHRRRTQAQGAGRVDHRHRAEGAGAYCLVALALRVLHVQIACGDFPFRHHLFRHDARFHQRCQALWYYAGIGRLAADDGR